MIKHREDTLGEYLLTGARPYLLIILIGLALYSGASFFGFSYLDDNILILDNHQFISNFSNIVEAFRQSVFHVLNEYDAAYRPILTVSLIIDSHVDKILGLGYHFSNIVFHIIASCLVFLFFLKLKYTRSLAFSFAMIFTVHPALTQAVAWIPGRNDSLLGIFTLASAISIIKYLDGDGWRYYALHILFLILALFTKESALALIIVSGCYSVFILDRIKSLGTWKVLSAGWIFSLALWLIMRSSALSHNPVILSGYAIARDLVLSAPAIFLYLGKVVFPFNLAIIPTLQDSTLLYGVAAALIIMLGLLLSKDRRVRFIIFGVIWFTAFLAPTFILPVSGKDAVFMESRIYLPILGIFIILGEIDIIKRISLKNISQLFNVTVIVSGLFFISMTYANNYQNAVTFWESAVNSSPRSAIAQYNLGWVYGAKGRDRDAEARYLRAIELDPRQRYVHNSLGCIYEYRGMIDRAEAEYIKEIEIAPYYEQAYLNLANLYMRQGREEKARELLKIIKKRRESSAPALQIK